MDSLRTLWLRDQRLSFSSAVLSGTALNRADDSELALASRASQMIFEDMRTGDTKYLSDSTLSLLVTVSPELRTPDKRLLPAAADLKELVEYAARELDRRAQGQGTLPSATVVHAAYLLRQQHLSMRAFFKWLIRCVGRAAQGAETALAHVSEESKDGEKLRQTLDLLLDLSRDAGQQSRDRVEAVDSLYYIVAELFKSGEWNWWQRICLALRNSLYTWPLLVAESASGVMHGISFPVGAFLTLDGENKVYFKDVLPRGQRRGGRRYVPPNAREEVLAHMERSVLCWHADWGDAIGYGLHLAKILWRSQNGRLRFADEAEALAKLNASLVIDMGPACEIVDSVIGALGIEYPLAGRSAEAYWVQVALGLLLPAGEIPMGAATGRVDYAEGAMKLRYVRGVKEKLQYANSAGFSRVVLPGSDLVELPSPSSEGDSSIESSNFSQNLDAGEMLEEQAVEVNVREFLNELARSNDQKRIEINYCQNARAAADAMQPSGWRRAAFLRMPAAQREFSTHLRRLYFKAQVEAGRRLSREERAVYEAHPWRESETSAMLQLDRLFLSREHALKFIDRARFEERNGDIEVALGKWLAWKDDQVRSGDSVSGMRGPGMGILCLRSTRTDNEMRLWATVADTLCVNPKWWDDFQWATRDRAAELLAKLLCNRRADPRISSSSAPDVLVLFDEGNLTQDRTNPVFPDDFRGQWLDLLNPTKVNYQSPHPLNEALLRNQAAVGGIGNTRIIVVYGPPAIVDAELPKSLDETQVEHLQCLSVFRFGFSIQAAFAVLNAHRNSADRLAWITVENILEALVSHGVMQRSRGQYYIRARFVGALRNGITQGDPLAHLNAAMALVPILQPRKFQVGANWDRALEPEPVLEATWHLRQARFCSPPRDFKTRTRLNALHADLTFLRPYPDWDTVKQLQFTTQTISDAVDLARDLLSAEHTHAGLPPHSSRVALLLNVIGDYGRGLNGVSGATDRELLATEATLLLETAELDMDPLGPGDKQRQKRKLYSEYAYCMNMLRISEQDERLRGSLIYLQHMLESILSPDFYQVQGQDMTGLYDYPASRDWFRARWEDGDSRSLAERSTTAYAAARLHIGRWRDGEPIREPWDQAWIEYFALTTPADFAPAQVAVALKTWYSAYGYDERRAYAFGQRVRDIASYRPRRATEQVSPWGRKVGEASRNLWDFLVNPRPDRRLVGQAGAAALDFLRVVMLPEAIPAFEFLEYAGVNWNAEWPRRIADGASPAWRALASSVLTNRSAWICLLAESNADNEGSLQGVVSWLIGLQHIGGEGLCHNDPDDLLRGRRGTMPLADRYRVLCLRAQQNGGQLLDRRGGNGYAIYGEPRRMLRQIIQEVRGA